METLELGIEKLKSLVSQIDNIQEFLPTETERVETLSNTLTEGIHKYTEDTEKLKDIDDAIHTKREQEKKLKKEVNIITNEVSTIKDDLFDLNHKYGVLLKLDKEMSDSEHMMGDSLKNKLKLFGLDVQVNYLGEAVYQGKVSFAEDKFVILNCDILQNSYDLQAMQPQPKGFEKMKVFMRETGDVVGFLSHARKYFLSDMV